jgi:hypothetical protein
LSVRGNKKNLVFSKKQKKRGGKTKEEGRGVVGVGVKKLGGLNAGTKIRAFIQVSSGSALGCPIIILNFTTYFGNKNNNSSNCCNKYRQLL